MSERVPKSGVARDPTHAVEVSDSDGASAAVGFEMAVCSICWWCHFWERLGSVIVVCVWMLGTEDVPKFRGADYWTRRNQETSGCFDGLMRFELPRLIC